MCYNNTNYYLISLFLIPASVAQAASLTWNNGLANMQWDTTSTNWTGSIWNNATPDSAIFGATGVGTVSLSTPITTAGLTFNTAGYIISSNTLTLSGTPTITTNADATISSILAGTGFTKTGSGVLTLSGTNTYTATTTINQGNLLLATANAVAGIKGDVIVNNGGTLSFSALYQELGTAPTNTVIVNNGGTLTLNKTQTFNNLTLNSTNITTSISGVNDSWGSINILGTLTASGTSQINPGASGSNQITPGGSGNRTLTVSTPASGDSLTIAAIVKDYDTSNKYSLTKTGLGTLSLSAANSYSGGTTISSGTIRISNSSALGTSTSGLTINNGSTLQANAAGLALANKFTFGTGGGIIDTQGNTLTLSTSTNSGTASFSKIGSGVLIVQGSGTTYSGSFYIKEGTLEYNAISTNTGLGTATINIGDAVFQSDATYDIQSGNNQRILANAINVVNAGAGATLKLSITGNAGNTGGNPGGITGAITLNHDLNIVNSASSGAYEYFSGGVTGTGNLIIQGNGTKGSVTFQTNPINNIGQIINQGTNAVATTTISSVIGTNVTGVTQNGISSMILSGSNTYGGVTNVGGGGKIIVSGTGSIKPVTGADLIIGANGGTGNFQYDSTATSTFATISIGNSSNNLGTLSQTAGVINASSLVLSAVASNNTGTVNLSGGVMNISGSANIGQRASSAGGGVGNLNVVSTGVLQVGGGLNIGFDPSDTRHGTGGVSQNGGTVTVTGGLVMTSAAASGYTRTATYNLMGGVLNVDQISQTANGDGTQTGTFNFAGGTLKPTMSNSTFMQGLTTVNMKDGGLNVDSNYDIGIAQSLLHYTGATTDSLTKNGTGTLTLSGVNTYAGTTTISAGILKASSTTALGSNTVGTVINGGTLDINGQNLGTENIIVSGTGVSGLGAIVNSGTDQISALGRIVLSGSTTIGGTGRWDLRNSTPTMDMGGYTLTKEGSNFTALVGVTVSNPGNIIINNGTFGIQTSSNMGGSSSNNITIANSGTLEFYSNTVPLAWGITSNAGSISQDSTTATINGPVTLNSGFTTINVVGTSLTASSSIISGLGGITKTGTGELNLSLYSSVSPLANTFSGGVNILAGTFKLSNPLGAVGQVVTPGGDASGTYYLGDTSGTSSAILAIANNNIIFNNPIIVQAGSSGNKTIYSSGGSGTSASLGSNVSLNDNLILNTAGSGTTLALNGQISGLGALTITGPGTVTLSGNNNFTGNVGVSSGKLKITNSQALGTGSKVFTMTGPLRILQLSNGITLGSNITMNLQTNSADDLGVVSSDGVNEIQGKMYLNAGGVNYSSDAGSTLTLSGNIVLDSTAIADRVVILGGASTNLNTVSGIIGTENSTYSLGVQKQGVGTWVLSNTNTYVGTTTISAGTLKIGNGGTIGSISASSPIVISTGATLSTNRSDTITQGVDFSNNISGAGSFIKDGTGTTVLSSANTYTGTTNVASGTLALTNANAVQSSAVTLSSGTTLNLRNNLATSFNSSGAILVSGTDSSTNIDVNNSGSGTGNALTLVNGINYSYNLAMANTHTRTINVTGGNDYTLTIPTVVVNNTATSGSGHRHLQLAFNPTSANVSLGTVTGYADIYTSDINSELILGGTTIGNEVTGVISHANGGGAFNVYKNGTSTWTLSGANTYDGSTIISAGTLAFTTTVPASNYWSVSHTSSSTYAQLTLPNNPDLTGKTINIQSTASDLGYVNTLVSWSGTATGNPTLQLNGTTVTSGVYVGSTKITYSPTAGITIARAIVPDAPTSPSATAGDQNITLSWSAVSSFEPVTYNIYNSLANTLATTTSATSVIIDGLNNGISYSYYITAVNSMGESASSTIVSATPVSVPSAPINLIATNYEDTISHLSWTAPNSDGGSALINYYITNNYGTATTTVSAATTTANITGLTNGIPYTFSIVAINGIGTSTATTSNSITPATIPDAPNAVIANSNEDSQSSILWTAPVSTGGMPIQYYTITSSPDNISTTSTTTTAVVTGLTNGTTYTFSVTATNVVGTSTAGISNTITPATITDAPQSPSAIFGDHEITVSWNPPTIINSPIVYYSIYDQTTNTVISTTTATSANYTGLTNGTTYYYYITATNIVGESASSSVVSEIPRTIPDAPISPVAISGQSNQIPLSWTEPANNGNAISLYNIYSSDTNLLFSTTTATSTVFYGLTNGNTYNFYLTALNNVGESASSTIFSATPYTFPDAPTPATATAGDNTQANLTWTTPTFDGGSVLTSYYITNDKGIATTTIATTSLSAAITGLANNTTYTFSVYAINAAGTSTSAITNTILTVPVAPNLTLISGDSCSDGIAKLSWNSVAGASGYIIYRDGTEVIKTWNTYYDDRALTLNREYAYTVRAYNATGNSLSSNSQSITASFSCGSIPLVNYPENTNPYPSTPTPSATVATTTPTTTVSTTTVPGNATSTTNIIPGVTGNNTNNTGNGSTGNTTTTKPVVLPVTPDNINYTPTTCDPYLNSYIQLGKKNNPEEVKKLQIFLNDYENANLIVDGIYKAQDVKAVNAFQLKYKQDVLSFWGLHTPTGWVYISTQKAINRVYCEQTKQLSCPYFKATTNLKTIPTPDEILKIKVFLNNTQNENLNTSDNTFNTDLTNAVKRFQAKYATNILKPWRLTKPTGTWYQSTRKYADELLGCFYPVRLDNGVVLK